MKTIGDAAGADGAPFAETHHALLFAWMAKAVCERAGDERGEEIIRLAVRRYGEERGRRMAARAKANGHALDIIDYFAYSEFKTRTGAMNQTLAARGQDLRLLNTKCPWYTAWDESGLMKWGCLYCREIDSAVLRGFNPELKLDVVGTRSNGSATCDFIFHGAKMGLRNGVRLLYRKTFRPGTKAIQSWDYHVGHLFTTLEKAIIGELGESGHKAVDSALNVFAERYGEGDSQRVLAYRRVFT
jgi:hypothetical protein